MGKKIESLDDIASAANSENDTLTSEDKDFAVRSNREGMDEDLAQLKAFSDKVYEEAIQLRGADDEDEASLNILTMSLKTNYKRLRKRLKPYSNALQNDIDLRKEDFEKIKDLEILAEKIVAIIAREENDEDTLSETDFEGLKLKKVKAREERMKMAKKGGASQVKIGSDQEDARVTDTMFHDIRRSEFKRFVEKSKENESRNSWKRIAQKVRIGFLVSLLIILPLSYFVLGNSSVSSRATVNPRPYRNIMEMKRAYEVKGKLVAVVPGHWEKLLPMEKETQIKRLVRATGSRWQAIEVFDGEGKILAEYKSGKVSAF